MHFTKAKQSNLFYCISFGTSQRGFTYIERGYCREGFGCMSKMSTLSFKMDLNSFTDYLLSTSRLKASDKIKFMVRNTRALCSCDFSAQSSFSISKIGNDWLRTQVLRSLEQPRCELHQDENDSRACNCVPSRSKAVIELGLAVNITQLLPLLNGKTDLQVCKAGLIKYASKAQDVVRNR